MSVLSLPVVIYVCVCVVCDGIGVVVAVVGVSLGFAVGYVDICGDVGTVMSI